MKTKIFPRFGKYLGMDYYEPITFLIEWVDQNWLQKEEIAPAVWCLVFLKEDVMRDQIVGKKLEIFQLLVRFKSERC